MTSNILKVITLLPLENIDLLDIVHTCKRDGINKWKPKYIDKDSEYGFLDVGVMRCYCREGHLC